MQRSDVVLAAMAAAGERIRFDPVRIQKLLFLIDRECAGHIGGPHFDFQPYLYGPFDKAVFEELEALAQLGQVHIERSRRRDYHATIRGQEAGMEALRSLPGAVRGYCEECAEWVLARSFGALLAAIYRKYPEMAVNSVAPGVLERYPRALARAPLPSFLSGMARALDLGATLDEYALEHDGLALHDAWRTVGDELRRATASMRHRPLGGDVS